MGKLQLSRKPGESFVIYDRNDGTFEPIVVTLVKVKGSRSAIVIEAAPSMAIMRSEVFAKTGKKVSA